MRNLKRALSLTLASVMLLGMMVMGTSAASFPDVDNNDNVEAIEVLSAVGVIVGDNGNFKPDAPVTRNEMAVIMTNLLGLNASDFAGTCPFTDVASWAQNYVAACYANNIIAGRSATVFDGQATVTAVEAAAMMMRALGYFQNSGDYNGGFTNATVRQAAQIRLFDGVAGSATAPMTRNDVAQLALNTLEADVVEFTGTLGWEFNGIVQGYDGKYSPKTDLNNHNQGYNYTGDTTTTHQKEYLQLLEDLYDGKLTKTSNTADAFGRTATTWKYDKEEIISATDEADMVYVGEVKAKDIYTDLNLKNPVLKANVEVFEDSENADAALAEIIQKDGKNTAGTGDVKFGADGQTVYVYYTAASSVTDGNGVVTNIPAKVKICIVSTYLGVVVDDDYTQDKKSGIRVDVFGEDTKFFETNSYKEDDVVLLTVADDKIQEILGAPQTITGEVTRIGTDSALTINGTKYAQSTKFDADGDDDVVKGTDSFEVENSYILYLDQNGVYLAAVLDEDNAKTDLVYIYGVSTGSTLNGKKLEYGVYANVVMMDGTYKEVLIGDTNDTKSTIETEAAKYSNDTTNYPQVGDLADLKYDEDDDEYTLAISADYDSNEITQNVELKTSDRYAKFTAAGNTYLNSETVYLFITADEDDAEKIEDVKVVTGGVDFDINASEMAGSAFAVKDGKNVAEYVVIMDEYEAATKDIVYIKSAEVKAQVKGGYTFEGYYAGETEKKDIPVYSVGGTATTADMGTKVATNGPAANTFYEYTTKSDGTLKLTAVTPVAAKDKAGSVTGVIASIENNMVDIESSGFVPYDMAGLKVVDLTDKDDSDENAWGSSINNVANLRNLVNKKNPSYDVTVDLYVNSDNEVKALFITNIAVAADPGPGPGPGPVSGATVTYSGTPTVNVADSDATGGKKAASASVTVGTLAGTPQVADIAVALKSGGKTIANGDKIEFTLTPATNATIAESTTANATVGTDGKVTLTKANGNWTNATVAVTAEDGTTTATYTVKVTEVTNTTTNITPGSGTVTIATPGAGKNPAASASVGSVTNGGSAVTVTLTDCDGAAEDDTVVFTVSPDGTGVTLKEAASGQTDVTVTLTYDGSAWSTGTVTAVAPAGNEVVYTFTVS